MTPDRLYVRAHAARVPFTGGTDRTYSGPTWSVHRNGRRLDALAVADGGPGLTLIRRYPDGWRMVTCWHAGIGPGAIARGYTPADL